MNVDESPSHTPWKAWVTAYLVAAILLVLLAFLLTWIQRLFPHARPIPQGDFVTEYVVEEPPEPSDNEKDSVVDPNVERNVAHAPAENTPADEPPRDRQEKEEEPPPEEDEDKPEEQTVVVVEEKRRQSVDQPTTNQETPDSDDYYLSDVDNKADVQTVAEDATTEYDDAAPVDARQQDSDTTQDEGVPEPTRENDTNAAQEPNERVDKDVEDERDNVTQGAENAPAEEQQKQEAAPKNEKETKAQEAGNEQQSSDTTLIDEGKKDDVKRSPQSQTVESFGRASGLGAKMEEAAKASKEDGRGTESVTRGGADFAHEHFDEVLGERTAVYKERAQQKRREESLLGDHQGQWQRTRQAMENFDIAVETGNETHLNTKRDDYARFINTYHAQIHEAWWQQVAIMDRRDGRTQESFDAAAVTLEMRILEDGSIDRVAIVRTSGNTFMDAEAIRINYAVKRTIHPPSNILCKDGAVYLHWTFSRGPGRCSTEGASMHCPK